MKIAWIRIKGFQQFEDTFLDFRHPETGKALEKVCLIGSNGTGKSTILSLIFDLVGSHKKNSNFVNDPFTSIVDKKVEPFFIAKVEDGGRSYLMSGINHTVVFSTDIEKNENYEIRLFELFIKSNGYSQIEILESDYDYTYYLSFADYTNTKLSFRDDSSDILIYCPSESVQNKLIDISDVPETTLNQALAFFNSLPYQHVISNETISTFWQLLLYLIKKRENDREVFEREPLNIVKSKKELINEFNYISPNILGVIAELWNKILCKANLRFDYENAKIPVQLTENLKAYIVNFNLRRVDYNKLSTGIRNFIFRFGHIKTLYFNRIIKRGIMLIDEPENSLFPDFLLDIVEQYQQVITDKTGEKNTQMFFATHSPIIASQFHPFERIVLEWDHKGNVQAKRGTSPIGDDPNDILYQDFGMTEIVSKEGQEIWKTYLELKKRLVRQMDPEKRKELSAAILEIGKKYNFEK